MTEEVSLLPLALAEVEREISLLDSEAERLTAEVSRLAVNKGSLQKTQRGLAELLGRIPPEPSPATLDSFDQAEGLNDLLVARNAFRNMAPTAAARKLLRRVGHRMTHPELVDALLKGNVKSKARFPSDSFRAAILRRGDWFVWKKEPGHFGCWELVEWQQEIESLDEKDSAGRRLLSLVKS